MISICTLVAAKCLRRTIVGRRILLTHYRVAVTGACLLFCCVEICLIGAWRIRSAQLNARTLTRQVIPSVASLLQTGNDFYQAQTCIERAIGDLDVPSRDALSETFHEKVSEATKHFAEARSAMDGSWPTGAEIDAYDVARTRWIQTAEKLVSQPKIIPSLRGARKSIDGVNGSALQLGDVQMQTMIGQFADLQTHLNRIVDQVYQLKIAEAATASEHKALLSYIVLLVSAGVGICAGAALTVSMTQASRAQYIESEAMNSERERQNERQVFDAQLSRALDMAQDEGATLSIIEEAVTQSGPNLTAEILLADSSRAHLEQAAATGRAVEKRCCNVGTPNECPAVRQGHRLSFESSRLLDACPHLKGRPEGNISATCIPLSIMGQTVGVLHAVSPENQLPNESQVRSLELIASKSSERMGLLRAFRQSEAQAACDPLTGLMNRRSLEEHVHHLTRQGTPFAVAYGDLDHFKALNDTYGHETGDKALRTFAYQLRSSVRPEDLSARWGGEEFVLVLPNTDAEAAATVIERVRTALAKQLQADGMARFTVSFGVAQSPRGGLFVDALARADAALLRAKHAGRNCTVVSGAPDPVSVGDPIQLPTISTAA